MIKIQRVALTSFVPQFSVQNNYTQIFIRNIKIIVIIVNIMYYTIDGLVLFPLVVMKLRNKHAAHL